LILAALAALALFFWLRSTKPVISGTFTVRSGEISAEVTIERDKWGVPLIRAANIEDMVWASGFVHASDRMFQMDLIRRLSTGRLSEIFGKRALESDKEQLDLMIPEGIERSLASVKPELNSIAQSYCRGVNYYMRHFPLPPEFKLLGYSPEPWKVADIFAIFKRMEIILAGSGSELYNTRVYAALGREKGDELLTGSNGAAIVNQNEYGLSMMDHSTLKAAYRRELDHLEKVIGSNNWVISGKKTKSGKPILANDPHLSNVFPSYFYQIRMSAGDIELSGNTIAGAPFIVIGKNSKVCWGFTNVGTDVIDYFLLEPAAGDPNQYILDGKKTPFTILEKHVKVKDQKDVIHRVRVSKFGPVMESGGKLLARHSVNEYPSTVLDALYQLNFARDTDQLMNALSRWSSPAQNVVFADSDGNIGYYPTGLIPQRALGNGAVPVPGNTLKNIWQGFYPEEKKPIVVNPEKGFMVTANNRVIPSGNIPLFAANWYPSFRADRITELLQSKDKMDVRDNILFQTDSFLKSGEFMMEIIGDHKPVSKGAIRIFNELKKWDGRADSGPGPLIFYRFEKHLSEAMFSDEFPDEESRSLVSGSWIYRLLNYPEGRRDTSALNRWADDKTTGETEVFTDMVERALELTDIDYLNGKEKGKPEWTEVHTLQYSHPLGSVFPLKYFLNRGPYGIKGGKDCIMVSTFRNRDDFNVVHLSTFRMILDMASPENSRMINSSGQSGHFMSKFYDDQIELFVRGKYRAFENPVEKLYKISLVPGR